MDLNNLPKNASSLKFSKFDQHVMGLCLSYKVNLGLSLRKTAHALHEINSLTDLPTALITSTVPTMTYPFGLPITTFFAHMNMLAIKF